MSNNANSQARKKQKIEPPRTNGNPLPSWSTLPTLALKLIFGYATQQAKHVPNISLSCKAFYQLYADSCYSLYADVNKLLQRKYPTYKNNDFLAIKELLSRATNLIQDYADAMDPNQALAPKRREWDTFLASQNKNAARLLSNQIFKLVSYEDIETEIKTRDMNARYSITNFGPVKVRFYGHEYKDGKVNYHFEYGSDGDYICEYNEKLKPGSTMQLNTLAYTRRTLDQIRTQLKLTDKGLIPDQLLLKAILLTTPWKFGTCYRYEAVMSEIESDQSDNDLNDDDDEEMDAAANGSDSDDW